MKNLLLRSILLLVITGPALAQESDTLLFETCNRLYEETDYSEAFSCYQQYDTNIYAIYMLAKIAMQLEDGKSLKKYSKKLQSKKYRSAESYHLSANLYLKDSVKHFQILNKGLKHYEHDTILLIDLSNYYLFTKDYTRVLLTLDELIKYKNEENRFLYFAKGYAHDRMGNADDAMYAYKKAIDIDPEYFDAYYNVGVLLNNQAVELFKKANYLTNIEEYTETKTEAEKTLARALPYFEKADEINPYDKVVLETLKMIYHRLDNTGKYEEIKARLEDMRGW
jgi:tetratricopeptide (TPR) repeat protein